WRHRYSLVRFLVIPIGKEEKPNRGSQWRPKPESGPVLFVKCTQFTIVGKCIVNNLPGEGGISRHAATLHFICFVIVQLPLESQEVLWLLRSVQLRQRNIAVAVTDIDGGFNRRAELDQYFFWPHNGRAHHLVP